MTYVLAAYGITGATLVLYALYLVRERARERKTLTRPASQTGQTNNG